MTFQPVFQALGGGKSISYLAGTGLRTEGLFYGEIDISGMNNQVMLDVRAAPVGQAVTEYGHRLYLHGGAGNSTYAVTGDVDLMTSGPYNTINVRPLADAYAHTVIIASNAQHLVVRTLYTEHGLPLWESLRFTGSFADVEFESANGILTATTSYSKIASRYSDSDIYLTGSNNTLDLGIGPRNFVRHVESGNGGHAHVRINAEDTPTGGIDLQLGGYGNTVGVASFLDVNIHGGLGSDTYNIFGSANIKAGGYLNHFNLIGFGPKQIIDTGLGHADVHLEGGYYAASEITFHGNANSIDLSNGANALIRDLSGGLRIVLHDGAEMITVENFGVDRGYYSQPHAVIELDGMSGLQSWADVQAALTPDGHGGLALHYASGVLDLVGVTKLDASFFVFG